MKKGISLIVLIITIIVMIIIAGAIIMSLSNTNIIDLAENAADEHNIAVEKEKIMLAIQEYHLQKATSANPKTLEQVLREQIADDAKTITAMGDGSISIVMKKTENRYVVSADGNVTGPFKPVGTKLEQYVFGEMGTGRDLYEIYNDDGDEPIMYNTDGLDVSFVNFVIDESGEAAKIYIRYNGNEYYEFQALEREVDNKEQAYTDPTYGIHLLMKIEEDSMVGKQLKYDGRLWTVIYDDETNGLQMLCNEAIANQNGTRTELGYDDPTIDESKVEHFEEFNVITDANERAKIEKAMYSYNNAIVTLNNTAKDAVTAATGIIKDIRSVGSNPINKNSENKNKFSSSEFSNLGLSKYDASILNGKGYDKDDNYLSDWSIMSLLNLCESENGEGYWLASRAPAFYYDDKDGYYIFGYSVLSVNGRSIDIDNGMVEATSNYQNEIVPQTSRCYIRPVITLEEGIIEKLTVEGTSGSPYDLDKYVEDHLVTNAEANVIANGKYYGYGEYESAYIEIADTGNVFYLSGTAYPATITINKGSVTMNVTIGTNTLTFDGNYYETISNNKILTLGMGDFGTSGNSKNARTGFLFALNTSDLKYDIEGAYIGQKSNTITFTKGSNLAKYTYGGQSTPKTYKYVGFKDMFYINDRQIKYSGLEDGFGWDNANGPYNKQ